MGKKKAGIILGAIALAAAAAVGIWYFLGNGGKDSNDRVYVQKVSTIMGTATGVQNRYSGVVQPQKTVEVNADSERTVKEILVEVGDEVSEGTPLFSYDTEDLKMELEQAKLELENQDIEISNYRNQIQELDKERKAAAEGDKFEYTTQIQTIETQIKQAEYEKSSKRLEMDKVQKKIDNSQVTSTTSGTIKSINDDKSPDQESSAFMTILSTGEYRIQGMANEQNVGMISSGTDVIIRSRVDEELTWTGVVDSLDTGEPSSDNDDMSMGDSENTASSSKYPFYVVMDDADGLMLGQHVLIELDDGQTEEREGIWLFSGYIVREGAQDGGTEGVLGDTEMSLQSEGNADSAGMFAGAGQDAEHMDLLTDLEGNADNSMEMLTDPQENADDMEVPGNPQENADDMELLGEPEGYADDMGLSPNSDEYLDGTETSFEPQEDEGRMPEGGTAYVWADDGNGRLEKRTVELGEYDAELDEYEILSGLTEDDLIAWPMEGLYEGVKTVTDMDEVDYNSDLYNQGDGTEAMFDTEYNMDDFDLEDSDWEDVDIDGLDGDDADLEDAEWDDSMDLEGGEDAGLEDEE